MITLTNNAVTAVKRAIAQSGKDYTGFRVIIRDGGCAGLKYLIGLDSCPREDDVVVEACGLCVFIDPRSAPMAAGVTVDFIEEGGCAGFAFRNANGAKCGCGGGGC